MRQWAAFVELEMAIETAIGFEGNREVREYVQSLAPEFIDRPEALTIAHIEPLVRMRDNADAA
jgi:chromosome condensin MukBEF complex kleisin-like MukF subunit